MNLPTPLLPTLLSLLLLLLHPLPATAETRAELQRSARRSLSNLYATTPAAKALGAKAAGVLVFPEILKGGFIVAAQYGNGVLFKQGKPAGYYNTTSGSFGFQAGVQTFGYALFFMTKEDLTYLDRSAGWELGVGPSITIVDVGIAGSLSTTTARKGVYAFFFDQKGLMGGLGLQGTKITKTHPK
jgi:lipid-binding SYLF domain-containing protein